MGEAENHGAVKRLLHEMKAHGKTAIHSLLKWFLPLRLIPVGIDMPGLKADKFGHQVTARERGELRNWLKDFSLTATGRLSMEVTIITVGGKTRGKLIRARWPSGWSRDFISQAKSLILTLILADTICHRPSPWDGFPADRLLSNWAAGDNGSRNPCPKSLHSIHNKMLAIAIV
ncbi:MAG: NAD(P)/FAD-dependent oxidoreductase [Candidatus Zixiibacteriota bacterium]|nr:MAG: NAD(P)/FAD-dependent oxidoreductase [candidate division Zixibacteria bacterium]